MIGQSNFRINKRKLAQTTHLPSNGSLKRFGAGKDFKTDFGKISGAKIESVLLKEAVFAKVKTFPDTEQKIKHVTDMIGNFDKAREKKEWDADDLNIFARTIGTLFDSEAITEIYEIFYAADSRLSKAEMVVALVRAPLVLGHDNGIPWAIADYDKYNVIHDEKTEKFAPIPPVDLSLLGSNPEGTGLVDKNIEELRMIEGEEEQLEKQISELQKKRSILREKKSAIEVNTDPIHPNKLKEIEREEEDPFESALKTVCSTFQTTIEKLSGKGKKSVGEEDTDEVRAARAFIKEGKMKEFYEFCMLPKHIQIKILCFQYFDLKYIMAAKDGLFEDRKKAAKILPGVTVTSGTST